jgi:anti-sigma B factor antagonist
VDAVPAGQSTEPKSVRQRSSEPASIDARRELDIAIDVAAPGTVVSLTGRLAAATVADVRAVLAAALESGDGDLIVDLAGVELVDASGLGVLVGAHRLASRVERRLVLRSVPPRIERLLAATHLNRVLTVDVTACA